VTAAALAELGLELELSGWAPWRLLEQGTEWILAPKSELLELLSGVRGLPLKEAKILSEEHKAVLLVVIGHRRKACAGVAVPHRHSRWRWPAIDGSSPSPGSGA